MEQNRYKRWVKEAIEIRKRKGATMNRDNGQYFLHMFMMSCYLKSPKRRKTTANTKSPASRSSTCVGSKDLRGNPKPRVSPDRTTDQTETGPGSGNILKNIFGSGRGMLFRVGVFFTGVWDIFSWDFGNKLAFPSQTEKVEWLLSLISTVFDVITLLQGIFTRLL